MIQKFKSTFKSQDGTRVFDYSYSYIDDFSELGDTKIKAVRAFCFCDDKLVLVWSDKKNNWMPPGGGVEMGETPEVAIIREIKEETNMRVIKHIPLGFIEVSEPDGMVTETRSFCLVEPDGPFTVDPDGDITEIKLVDPVDYKKYFDWGEVGDYIMQRALELLREME